MATQGEPRYTIEQIELLRRLMRTGLTKQEIIHALETMTKLDSELSQGASAQVQHTQSPLHHLHQHHQQQLQLQQQIQQQHNPQPILTQHQMLVSQSPPPQQHMTQMVYVTSPASSATPAVDQLMTAVHQAVGNGNGKQQQQIVHPPTTLRIRSVVGGDNEELKCGFENFDVADEEVNELFRQVFRRGTQNVKEEIKEFLSHHKITQNQISHATGISQSYISQYLLHGSIMRQTTQALFYRWYLGKMKEMDLLEKEVDGNIESCKKRHEYPGKNSHLMPPIRRRERFSWNEACLKVLESYWKKNPYPNDLEREKITEACNAAQQTQTTDSFVEINRLVTPAKVYNWFANRRKDANRRKRISGENSNNTETAVVTFTAGDPDASPSDMLQIHEAPSDMNVTEDASQETTTTITFQQHQTVQQQQHDQPQLELDTVNNSIITLIEAVEEKNHDKS